eukprot:m.18632 g.18632  ORF g.18632 m.18632 type:complete len:832 (-) comp11532_c0_seq2:2495-4990(-)
MSTMKFLAFTIALWTCVVGASDSASQAHIRKSVLEQEVAQLDACANALENSHPVKDAIPERATLALARLFQNYSATDAANINHIAESYAAYYNHKNVTASDLAAAEELPALEVNLTIQAVQIALTECTRIKGGGYRRASRKPPTKPLVLDTSKGYFVDPASGIPYFTTGYSQSPVAAVDFEDKARSLGMSCNVLYFSPRMILSSTQFNTTNKWALEDLNATLVQQRLTETNGYVALGNGNLGHGSTPTSHALPDWAEAHYLGITTRVGKTHFYSYDIDHPGAKAIWTMVLQRVASLFRSDDRVLGWSLSNEPGFFVANSTYTLAGFTQFLQARYHHSAGALAAAWELPDLRTFADPRVLRAMGAEVYSVRQQLDWGTYNNQRVTAFYTWLCNAVREHTGNPDAKCWVKASNSASGVHGDAQPNGIDREGLTTALGVQGCDTRLIQQSAPHYPISLLPSNEYFYAQDWIPTAAGYDFMRSVSRRTQPVVETEWHAVSTVSQRARVVSGAHIRAGLYLAHVHGMALNVLWFWGRIGWTGLPSLPKEFGGADFAMSSATQPAAMNAYLRTTIEANGVAAALAGMASQPPQVWLVYAASGYFVNEATASGTLLGVYSLLHSLGVPIGFATESDLVRGALFDSHASNVSSHGAAGPGSVYIIATNTTYLATSAVAALQEKQKSGATVLLVGEEADVERTLRFDDTGLPAPTATTTWLAERVPLVRTHGAADADSMHAVEAALPALARPQRCVVPGTTLREPGTSIGDDGLRTQFGVLCRCADNVLIIINLVNVTTGVDVVARGIRMPALVDVFTNASVSTPLSLAPLETHLFHASC